MSLETNWAGRGFADAALRRGMRIEARGLWLLGAGVGLFAFWFLRHPYYGVWHDARIYMGRGLADLDPKGVGADLFFRFDGQSSFSVFSKIVDFLIPLLGYAESARLLTFTALAFWFAALALLVAQITEGRWRWALLFSVAAAGGGYGGFGLLSYAENFATPRPFAEAFVLAALAFLLAKAGMRAILCVALAAAFHPIMAFVGAIVIYLHLCLEDRRWIYLGAVGALGVVAAAFGGAPLFARLLQNFDADWLLVLRQRTTYLFPLSWPAEAWSQAAVVGVTLGYAAELSEGKQRRLFACVIAASLFCLSVAILFGDVFPLRLITQAQLWRALWLATLMATLSIGVIASRLLDGTAEGRAALALLALAWLTPGSSLSPLYLLFAIFVPRLRGAISEQAMRLLANLFVAIVVLVAATEIVASLVSLINAWREAPPNALSLSKALGSGVFLRAPVIAMAIAWPPMPL